MRAAIYCRISLDQTGQALGVTRQEEDCRELAASIGWDVAEVYVDNDISATSGKPRPSYARMLKAVEAGELDALVAWSPDRLYRKLDDLQGLITVVEARGALIRTVKAGEIDLSTAYGRGVARILGSVATMEGEIKSERWKRSVRQRREAGTFAPSGPRMFGWERDGSVVPAERETARWMAEQILDGVAVNEVCRQLAARGSVTHYGNAWQPQTVTKFLANPKVAGYATLNGDIIGDGTWEPLLDRGSWEQVRALLNTRRRGAPAPRVALLAGLLFCGRCEAPMVTGSRMNKRKETVRTYRCIRLPQVESCQSVSGVAEAIEDVAEGYAQERWRDPRVQERQAELRGQPPGLLAELGDLEGRVVELDGQLDQPRVPVEALLRARDRVTERISAIQDQLATAPAVRYVPGGVWPADLARRRALVEAVIERVWLDPFTKPSAEFDPTRVRIDRRD